jgi:tetratricopeptide (TPR) repeat protein
MAFKRISLFFIIPAILVSFCKMAVYAQSSEQESLFRVPTSDIWQDSVNELRLYVNSLVQENQRLTAANEELERQIGELEKSKQAILERKECLPSADKGNYQLLKKAVEEMKRKNTELRKGLDLLIKQETDKTWEQEGSGARKGAAEAKQQKNLSPEQLKSENTRLLDQLDALRSELFVKVQEVDNLKRDKDEAIRQQEITEVLLQIQLQRSAVTAAQEGAAGKVNHELAGYNLATGGKYAQAAAEYQKALEDTPNNKNLYFNLGSIYYRMKDYHRAAGSYEKVLNLDPKDKEAIYNLSKIYKKLSDPAKAKYYFDLYLKQDKR